MGVPYNAACMPREVDQVQDPSQPPTDELLTAKHKRLLSIADWAKYGAWFMLAIGIATAGITLAANLQNLTQPSPEALWQGIADAQPATVLDILAAVSGAARGLVYAAVWFIVLRGVWMGLNMIVETDVNLRHSGDNGGGG